MEEPDDWPITGEVPGGEDLLYGPARDYLKRRVEISEGLMPDDHELATQIGEHHLAVDSLKLRASRWGRKYSARFLHEAGEHKKEIAVTLTVAGVLLAARHIHARRKK